MCGIAGFLGCTGSLFLPNMIRTLRHRGPDDQGSFEAAGVGLGMSRLAIIDLRTGNQPIWNEDGSACIIFNGEIYNYRDLRNGLETRGHRLQTCSDTETILHLYEEVGDACVDQLRGMFAFAIWDAKAARLFLARDRMGKKPLFYWQKNGQFLFASEIKALLCHPDVSRDINWLAFQHYLAFGYTPADQSIFTEIRKLPPAHVATFGKDRVLKTRCYWSLPESRFQEASTAETAARVHHVVREAVQLRLESDVPLGVFLSGGIDSSVVVACMREVTSQPIATFSIGFGGADPSFDELAYARMVAQRFETRHTEEILKPKVTDLLPTIIDHFDEPFADSSAIPTFIVAQATARHVKVALSGIGGDEAFGGYPRYLGVRLSETYSRVPRVIRDFLNTALLRSVPETDHSRNWADWIRRFTAGANEPMPSRYINWTRFFADSDLTGMATPALNSHWSSGVDACQRKAFGTGKNAVDGAFRIDLSTYLPDDLLAMADRMSMANSLELRAPFCDHRVIEDSLHISPGMKIPGFRLKGLLKRAFADVLPPEVVSHRKQGFMIPLGRWLRTDLRPVMEDLLSPDVVRGRGLFIPEFAERLKREHLAGVRSHSDRLWTLMMAELWMRRYLDTGGPWSIA
jgi:asparagine synthase (glutamine-hydrolysing)